MTCFGMATATRLGREAISSEVMLAPGSGVSFDVFRASPARSVTRMTRNALNFERTHVCQMHSQDALPMNTTFTD